MSALYASQILLWVAFLVLAAVVLALARQVGVLHERIAPAGALTLHQSVRSGDPAPRLDLVDLWGRAFAIGAAREHSLLILFVSPDCPVCKRLLPIVKSAAATERGWLDVVFASDGEEAEHRAFAQRLDLDPYGYLLSEALGR
ncbi:MAG TPA: methylamine dehydrogenase, partial [Phenylobacterium sp.]